MKKVDCFETWDSLVIGEYSGSILYSILSRERSTVVSSKSSRCGPRTHVSMIYFHCLREETIKSMSNREAIGPDELSAELLKLILDEDRYGNHHILGSSTPL